MLDEGQNIQDVRLFWPMLKLVERKGDKLSKTLNCKIDALVGNGDLQKLHLLILVYYYYYYYFSLSGRILCCFEFYRLFCYL